jgi:membrane protease YdiL (CAAX protease family)
MHMGTREQDRSLVILAILSAIYLLNDFLFMRAGGYIEWLAIDYGSRFLAIGIILYLFRRKISVPAEFGLKSIPFRTGLVWVLVLAITGVLIDQAGWRFFERVLPFTQLASMPKIGNPLVRTFDLTFGVTLVAVSEEMVFRGYCYSALHDRMSSPVLVLASAVLFGLIHWSTGLHAIISTALWGILPMVAMIRTRSVLPAMIAHYITDLVSLGGFVPESWFDFMK